MLRTALIVVLLLFSSYVARSEPTGTLVVAFGAEPTTMDPARYAAGVDLYGVT